MKAKLDTRFLRCEIADFFAKYRHLIAIFAAVFVVGAAIGIAVALKVEDLVKQNVIEELKSGEFSMSSAFFRALLFGFITSVTAYLAVFKRGLTAISALWLGYVGYRAGMLAVGCCNVAKSTGVICVIFLYAPVWTAMILLACAIVAAASAYWLAKRAAMTCRASLIAVAERSAIFFALYAIVALICCVIVPWLIKLLFL